ncbi:transcriptional regulator [Bacillus sp. FJAT-18017]|uniref:PLD nuclease N-terminal domain-containing protein n=1 Tax=unclassified Bacillus (in: firmicutes) TaxID=185979 RepID=UPI0005C78851|nr:MULTISPECIES: PLD nuclease N-terminal domain-containing protein [unclassified Bacillus (in: firmicutes)]ALC90797.1 transcriptional regulator [Bacillus sp. FJAT-18017]
MEALEGISWGLLLPVLLISLLLLVVALVDLIRIERTNGPKWVWAIVIVVITTFGPILYFVFGRRNY